MDEDIIMDEVQIIMLSGRSQKKIIYVVCPFI